MPLAKFVCIGSWRYNSLQALCDGVKSMSAERSCGNYTSGTFGVPLSQETPILVALHRLTQH